MAETDAVTTSSAVSASTSGAPETKVAPLNLSQLCTSLPSDLASKRKVKVDHLVGKRSHEWDKTNADPKSVSPATRVHDFPNKFLNVSAGKLFCTVCTWEELGLKASTIWLHIKSQKHQNGKERVFHKEVREKDIAEAFEAYNQEAHLARA